MPPHGADAGDAFAGPGYEFDVARALMAPPGAEQIDVDAERLKASLAPPPFVDGSAVRHPEYSHGASR